MDKIKFRKTSSIILIDLLISTLLLSGCHDTDNSISDTNTEAVPANYAAGVEQATDEFLSFFSSFQNLEVAETSTMVRTDVRSLIVIQFTIHQTMELVFMVLNIRRTTMEITV